jgi:stage V sporulation protein B
MALNSTIKQVAFRSGILVIIKIMGALVRIPLFRIFGAEGVGLYQMIYALYGLMLTVVTGGFPTAITFNTAKDQQQGLKMLKAAVLLLIAFGLIIGLLFYSYALQIADILGDHRLIWSIRLLAPAIVIVPLLSLMRGYLQGLEFYGPIAVSELIEQVFRVLTIIVLVSLWIQHSLSLAVGGAVFGAVVGAWIALCFLMPTMWSSWNNQYSKDKRDKISFFTFIWLIRASSLITASRLIIPFSDFIDALIIPHRLQHAGHTMESSIAIYGIFTGMAASIVYVPTLITAAVSHIYAAKIAADWKKALYYRFHIRAVFILQRGWIWGIGCSLFLFYNYAELSNAFFGNEIASQGIFYLALAPLIAGMREISTTILWAADMKREPMLGLILGIILASAAGYFLVGQSKFSFIGIAVELLALECIAVLWNLRILYKINPQLLPLKYFSKEALIMFIAAWSGNELGRLTIHMLTESNRVSTYGSMTLSFICIFGLVMIRSKDNPKRNLFKS